MKRIAFALYALALLAAVRAIQHRTAAVAITSRRHTGGSYSVDKAAAQQAETLEPGRGRNAKSPAEIPALGWKDVLFRVYYSLQQDRVMLIAAGSTFYLLLALFPALTAFVSLYGLLADRATVSGNISLLAGVVPNDAVALIQAQLEALATQDVKALGVGFFLGLSVALWSANNGFKSIFEALNVAYGEKENRSFVRLNLISFLFTLGGLFFAIVLIIVLGAIPALLASLGFAGWSEALINIARWPLMAVIAALAVSVLYRFGPDREYAKWRWLSFGAVFSALVWIIASAAFTFYLANFADYNATYGTLGAVVGLMMWTWISLIILILGAELNAELEQQTAMDSTTGAPRPMGERGAVAADTIGEATR
ncbi:YihY/virulence factor BrkB family protein [Candidatus Phyllobacterium onerii]|uniref:YihY/virulence factor BrkB family protein n=1 Tax=Candidatus Phyllobacterium onerii TaxID=3020828 RepID=UPI00232C1FC2|nr:YihY/virulence factor BrkB family protein [Phyllobacterium sp. IY22]